MSSFNPSAINIVQSLYPIGNTPAVCLTQELPPEESAFLLLLGCGDARNILFTAYADTNAKRQFDFTCCDNQATILARNILLFALLQDEDLEHQFSNIWNFYYSLYISEEHIKFLHIKAKELLALSESSDTWSNGKYGRLIEFCDNTTRLAVRQIWTSYCVLDRTKIEREFRAKESEKQFERAMQNSLTLYGNLPAFSVTALRAAAPLSQRATDSLPFFIYNFWTRSEDLEAHKYLNPTFMPPDDSTAVLHYATDYLFGFHIATAYPSLNHESPLRPADVHDSKAKRVLQAVRTEFLAWASSFKSRASNNTVTIRMFLGDALNFAYSLQEAANGHKSTQSNFYQQNYSMEPTVLSEKYRESKNGAPKSFNVIDTSNLADHVGTINLLLASAPLMKDKLHSSIYTETLLMQNETIHQSTETLLKGDFGLISTLLKLFPVEYWTNSSPVAPEEAVTQYYFENLSIKGNVADTAQSRSQFLCRILWKMNSTKLQNQSLVSTQCGVKHLSNILFQIYLNMFQVDDPKRDFSQLEISEHRRISSNHAQQSYHRGSFAAFCAFLKGSVSANWDAIFKAFFEAVKKDKKLLVGERYIQELYVYFHFYGLCSAKWIKDPIGTLLGQEADSELFIWRDKPGILRVTLVVPRSKLQVFTENIDSANEIGTPNVCCSIEGYNKCARGRFHNTFSAVSLAFGRIKAYGERNTSSFSISVKEDPSGWRGKSSLIVSFWTPTLGLLSDPSTGTVSFGLEVSPNTAYLYLEKLGYPLKVYETALLDREHVYITKAAPGLPEPSTSLEKLFLKQEWIGSKKAINVSVTPKTDRFMNLTSMVGRIEFLTQNMLGLLRTTAKVSTSQKNVFCVNVLIEKDSGMSDFDIYFPVPIDHTKCAKRVSPKTGNIEVTVPVIKPPHSILHDSLVVKSTLEDVPVLWGMPRLNLDCLPILDRENKADLSWLVHHTSWMWSEREQKIREAHSSLNTTNDAKLNFKESLFSIFMSYARAQTTKASVFALNHKARGGIETLIFPQALRLDIANSTIVLDAVVLPLKHEQLDTELLDFVGVLFENMKEEPSPINLDDNELAIWKNMIAVYVERCRTWQHAASCEYRSQGSMPVSTKYGETPICSCGVGKVDIAAIRNLPRYELIASQCVRAAISPYYGLPYVERLLDPSILRRPPGKFSIIFNCCARCYKAGSDTTSSLSQCGACNKVKYCSKNCQRLDWTDHKKECKKD